MKKCITTSLISVSCILTPIFTMNTATAKSSNATDDVTNSVILKQRQKLAKASQGQGFGPQSPRDIDQINGNNQRLFNAAPAYAKMNLCNIHFHKSAEHKGGQFTRYAGNGNGKGYGTGYQYTGTLTSAESEASTQAICPSKYGALQVGDTIEVHYVHSSA